MIKMWSGPAIIWDGNSCFGLKVTLIASDIMKGKNNSDNIKSENEMSSDITQVILFQLKLCKF